MSGATIVWGWSNQTFTIQRLIISTELPEAQALQEVAAQLGIPIIIDKDETLPAPGDMWIYLLPRRGWGRMGSSCAAAYGFQAGIVLKRLCSVRDTT